MRYTSTLAVSVSASSSDWLLWGRMTSSESSELSGDWAPPTGPAHPDPAVHPGHTTDAPVRQADPSVGQPDGVSETTQSLTPPGAGAQATVILDDPHRRSKSRAPLMIIGALLLLAFCLFLADWAARNIEAMRLLDQIEKSEAAMGVAQEATVEVAKTAPKGTFPLPPDKDLPTDIASELEEISATGRDAVAEAGQGVAAVSFFPWHSDLIAAQASYLDHNLAWVNHFEAGSEEGEVLVRGDDGDIESTWAATEIQIRAAMPLVPFPGIADRVDTIFEEGTNENSGSNLQVSGSIVMSGLGSGSVSSRGNS